MMKDFMTRACLFSLGMLMVAGIVMWCVSAARADTADCGLIRDHDMQRQCYAIRDRHPGDCNLIQDDDVRRLCRAQTERR